MQLISNIPTGSNIFLVHENQSNRILLAYSLQDIAADIMPEAKERLLTGITNLLKEEILIKANSIRSISCTHQQVRESNHLHNAALAETDNTRIG
jgi:hypothetical protein